MLPRQLGHRARRYVLITCLWALACEGASARAFPVAGMSSPLLARAAVLAHATRTARAAQEQVQTAMASAVSRGVQNPAATDAGYNVDSAMAAWIADQVAAEGASWFVATTKAERAKGVPSGYRMVQLPPHAFPRVFGLREGDIVQAVGSARPPSPKRLVAFLKIVHADVDVAFVRDGTAKTIKLTVQDGLAWREVLRTRADRELPKAAPLEPTPKPARQGPRGKPAPSAKAKAATPTISEPVRCSGARCTVNRAYYDALMASPGQAKSQLSGTPTAQGFELRSVKSGSAAHKAGFRAGDVVTEVNGKQMNSTFDMLALYGALPNTRTFRVTYVRGTRTLHKTLVVE